MPSMLRWCEKYRDEQETGNSLPLPGEEEEGIEEEGSRWRIEEWGPLQEDEEAADGSRCSATEEGSTTEPSECETPGAPRRKAVITAVAKVQEEGAAQQGEEGQEVLLKTHAGAKGGAYYSGQISPDRAPSPTRRRTPALGPSN